MIVPRDLDEGPREFAIKANKTEDKVKKTEIKSLASKTFEKIWR